MFALLATAVLAAAPSWPLTPREAVHASVAYYESIDAGLRNQQRLLMLPGATPEERQKSAMAVSYLINSVARTRLIVVPSATSSEWNLLVVDLSAYADLESAEEYGTFFEEWEKLAEFDPYWKIRTQVVSDGVSSIVTVDGGWVDIEEAKMLRELSGSFGAVLRADYFCAQVAEARYYDWAGIPATETEFLAQIGIDVKTVDKLAAGLTANLERSGVTRKPRRIIHRPSVFGASFQTKDVDRESPLADPIRVPINDERQAFQFAASEWFVARANGMWGTALYDKDGNRQATVPDGIAKDWMDTAAGDGIIRPFLSCVRCHEANGGAGGLQPFDDDQSFLLSHAFVGSDDPVTVQRIAELYDPGRLGKFMARAREDYEDAVSAATGGMTPAEAVTGLAEIVGEYLDLPVTPEKAANELRVPVESLKEVFAGTTDPVLLLIANGRRANRAAWESSYPEAANFAASSWKGESEQ